MENNASSIFCQVLGRLFFNQKLSDLWNEDPRNKCIFIYGQKSHPDLERLQQASVEDAGLSEDMFAFYWESDSSSSSSSTSGPEIPVVEKFQASQDHYVLIKHILLYVMMAIGVPANFLILYVSFKNRKKLPSSSWLVINLALSDFLLLLSVPLEVSRLDFMRSSFRK